MSRERNIASQEHATDYLNAGDIDAAVDTLFAPDAVDHDLAPGQRPGREGFRDFFRALFAAFPDLYITGQVMIADDEYIAMAYTMAGHHRGAGDFRGVTPTGKPIEVRGMQIAQFSDGQIVQRWGATDELAILRQLDVATAGDDQRGVLERLKRVFSA